MAKEGHSNLIIQAQNLGVDYGKKPIWHGADFEVKKGQFVGVLGPNGAGKTTLFRLLLGLLTPTHGQLNVFGRQPRRGDKRIGYMPQRHIVSSETRLEALEIVKLGLNGYKWGIGGSQSKQIEEAALKTLADVEAEHLAHQSIGFLSGGELQRIFLAQALVGRPNLLLLDEPLANLDIRRQTNLIQLISKVVKSRGLAVLLIAHDINPLMTAMDGVIYMANGQVATGKPSEVINTETLSKLYDSPVEVLRDSQGRVAVLGAEEAAHPHG
ncbi:MAG TPA: ATP-binding cassette domain-containing protein [Candidatus Saccharimonadales bacterium]|nr:ATP-binding cassette domain-containing protein [Candidatus Saccharimonadales bacterium]